ncbi:MAG: flavin reductase family protein [Lachnospiraceae bacterium]|jgi:flavin reductase (DIM6/NTAB) family NADH-FMN oxidoreductase RutF|nr:flavin reductase family protein [Lachnospiraceae bacterium]
MGKQSWKPGNMLYPLPVVLVSAADEEGNTNVLTVAWAGTVCSDPPMVSVSIRPDRHSYRMIKETGEFVINLTTEELAYAADYCGVVSGRDADKFKNMHLTPVKGDVVKAPLIKESPVNIECIVKDIKSLGSHDMFIAQVAAVHVDEKYMDTKNKFHLEDAHPIVYSHGIYMSLGKKIGTFGYSVRKGPNPRGGRKSK